jgi:hypothetical protein
MAVIAGPPGDRRGTVRPRVRAAVMESAAGRRVDQRRYDAWNGAESSARRRAAGHRHAAHQAVGVRMTGRGEQLRRIRMLDDLARVHYGHPVGDLRHDAEIVGDQQHADAGFSLQALDQPQDLRLDGDVQRSGRFIGDQQFGLADQCHRDHHALAQPAGKLMRILAEAIAGVRDPDTFEHAYRARPCSCGILAQMAARALGELVADRVGRVQRGHRLLENHRHPTPAQRVHARTPGGEQVDAVQMQVGGAAARRSRQQVHQRQRGHRLAAAGLAHQADGLAALDGEIHAAHRMQATACGGQIDVETGDFEQCHLSAPCPAQARRAVRRPAG